MYYLIRNILVYVVEYFKLESLKVVQFIFKIPAQILFLLFSYISQLYYFRQQHAIVALRYHR